MNPDEDALIEFSAKRKVQLGKFTTIKPVEHLLLLMRDEVMTNSLTGIKNFDTRSLVESLKIEDDFLAKVLHSNERTA